MDPVRRLCLCTGAAGTQSDPASTVCDGGQTNGPAKRKTPAEIATDFFAIAFFKRSLRARPPEVLSSPISWLSEPTTGVHSFGGGSGMSKRTTGISKATFANIQKDAAANLPTISHSVITRRSTC